jgi:hypothetical protein
MILLVMTCCGLFNIDDGMFVRMHVDGIDNVGVYLEVLQNPMGIVS